MLSINSVTKIQRQAWNVLRSPRTIALLKLGAAVVGVIHAIDELRDSPKTGKLPIGFRGEED